MLRHMWVSPFFGGSRASAAAGCVVERLADARHPLGAERADRLDEERLGDDASVVEREDAPVGHAVGGAELDLRGNAADRARHRQVALRRADLHARPRADGERLPSARPRNRLPLKIGCRRRRETPTCAATSSSSTTSTHPRPTTRCTLRHSSTCGRSAARPGRRRRTRRRSSAPCARSRISRVTSSTTSSRRRRHATARSRRRGRRPGPRSGLGTAAA